MREGTIKVGLVDDHPYDLEKMSLILSKEDDVDIVFATSDAKAAYEKLKTANIDLLITDIEMPHLSGYELADFINSYALDIKVIFVTGHSGYAVHAFEIAVLDYIMKPYSKERLLKGIQRLQRTEPTARERDKLVLKSKTDIVFIRTKDIIFIERTGRRTTIVAIDGEYTTYQSLNELEEQLSKRNFLRAHRGFIINIHFIKNFSLYAKNSYTVTFQQTDQTAMITKANLDKLQQQFF